MLSTALLLLNLPIEFNLFVLQVGTEILSQRRTLCNTFHLLFGQVDEVDEDFEKEFAALMSDYKVPTTASYPSPPTANNTSSQGGASSGSGTVSFKVMMKFAVHTLIPDVGAAI